MPDLPQEAAEVRKLMTEFSTLPFPDSCDGVAVEGILLEVIDGNAVGCISAYVKGKGSLDATRRQVLEECARDLERVRPGIPEDAVEYFDALGSIVSRVLAGLP